MPEGLWACALVPMGQPCWTDHKTQVTPTAFLMGFQAAVRGQCVCRSWDIVIVAGAVAVGRTGWCYRKTAWAT